MESVYNGLIGTEEFNFLRFDELLNKESDGEQMLESNKEVVFIENFLYDNEDYVIENNQDKQRDFVGQFRSMTLGGQCVNKASKMVTINQEDTDVSVVLLSGKHVRCTEPVNETRKKMKYDIIGNRVPRMPIFLSPTHVTVSEMDRDCILAILDDYLANSNTSHTFDEIESSWRIVTTNEQNEFCEFILSLYSSSSSEGRDDESYVLEALQLYGNERLFQSAFSEIRGLFDENYVVPAAADTAAMNDDSNVSKVKFYLQPENYEHLMRTIDIPVTVSQAANAAKLTQQKQQLEVVTELLSLHSERLKGAVHLSELSSNSDIRELLVEVGAVAMLLDVFRSVMTESTNDEGNLDVAIIPHALSALYNLRHNQLAQMQMVDDEDFVRYVHTRAHMKAAASPHPLIPFVSRQAVELLRVLCVNYSDQILQLLQLESVDALFPFTTDNEVVVSSHHVSNMHTESHISGENSYSCSNNELLLSYTDSISVDSYFPGGMTRYGSTIMSTRSSAGLIHI